MATPPKTPEQKAKKAAYHRKWYLKYRERIRASQNAKREARSPAAHASHIRFHYGLTVEQYATRLAAQGGVCAICAETCRSGRRLAVDHDHATGQIRGLLCARCNTAIGSLRESPALFHRALAYISETARVDPAHT